MEEGFADGLYALYISGLMDSRKGSPPYPPNTHESKETVDIRPPSVMHRSKTSPHKQNESDKLGSVSVGNFISRCLLGNSRLAVNDTKLS